MFTGLVESLGVLVESRSVGGAGKRMTIQAPFCAELKKGDSVAVNGACLTVIFFTSDCFTVEAVGSTLSKTTLAMLRIGAAVNLERAMKVDGRLDGHLVQGHVSTLGKLIIREARDSAIFLTFQIPREFQGQVVKEGSIAVDGVSLTVAGLWQGQGLFFQVSVIPHTLKNTNLHNLVLGTSVNVETDQFLRRADTTKTSDLTLEKLGEWGY